MKKYPALIKNIEWYRTNVPCMEACPVHTDSGRYVQLIAEKRYLEAFTIARSPNPMASVCGRICSAPCEDACRRGWYDAPVTIRPLKRFLTEKYGSESAHPDTFRDIKDENDPGYHRLWHLSEMSGNQANAKHKTAVIGAGPAGVACAHDLAVMGYSVTLIEGKSELGGMLRYGIPEYRLPRGVIEREISALEKLGVEIRTGLYLSESYNLKDLKAEGFEAVFISVGASKGRDIDIPGSEKDGVIKAVDYLLNLNRGYKTNLGKRVVVIGGGFVALDAARSFVREFYNPMEEIQMTAESAMSQPAFDAARGALKSGSTEVHIFSLESYEDMPAAKTVQGREELSQTLEEGVELHPSWGPKAIIGGDRVTGIEMRSCIRVFDENGRFNPEFDESKVLEMEADSVILAIGQQIDTSFITDDDGVEISRAGTIKIDPDNLATTAPGIFAGGDAAFGPRIAIEAVSNGKRAAQSISRYLSGEDIKFSTKVEINKIPAEEYFNSKEYELELRKPPESIEISRRTGISEVENVYDENEAIKQAKRCLLCHIDTIYDPELCVLCGRCADICPERCLIFVPLENTDIQPELKEKALENYNYNDSQPLTALLKDDTICIRCGLCAVRCPTEAMTMERISSIETAITH